MNVIHSIGLKDVGPFKEVQFKIPAGVSVIYGLNRAGGKASKNSNGVGKSLLTSSISDILYDEPIIGEKSDSLRVGTRAVSMTTANGKKLLVRRSMRGKSESIQIKVDGVDKKYRTSAIAKAALKKLWPINNDEHNTYVHIDSRSAHPLVMGTSTERKHFFTSFFGLDRMDVERKLFTAELSKLGKVKAAFQELRDAYEKAKQDLIPEEQLGELKARLKRLRRKLVTLQDEFSAVQETVRLVQFAEASKQQIATLKVACGGHVSVAEFDRAVADNKWELDKTRKDLEDAEAWDQYQRDNAHYQEAYTALSAEARKYLKANGRAALSKAREAARLLSKYREVLRLRKADVEGVETQLAEPMPEKVDQPDGDEGELGTLRRAYAHQLEHAEQFQEGKCETCGQVVKIKDPKVLRKKLDSLVDRLDQHAAYREYKAAAADRQALVFKLKSYKSDVRQALEKVETVKEEAAFYSQLKDLPRKPKPFEGKKLQTKVLKIAIDELVERRALLRNMASHVETIIEFQNLTKADLQRVKGAETLTADMNRIQELLSRTAAKLEVHETISSRVADMRSRLVEMKAQLKDEEALRLLVQGYQDKNMKKMAVEAISSHLMQIVNKYARSIFPEDYTFEFKWDTQVRLLVHRKYGKRVDTSDVRKLSGAESKLFTIVLVMALLSFVPSHKRCSVMILDEPSANMSKEMTQSLQDLLPILNKLIPSIVVITPRSEEIYEGAKPYTILKSRGVATLHEGFPNQVDRPTNNESTK